MSKMNLYDELLFFYIFIVVFTSNTARVLQDGPLFQERGSRLLKLLQPLSGRNQSSFNDVNSTLEVLSAN